MISDEWYVLSQGPFSFDNGSMRLHYLVAQFSLLTVLKRLLLGPPPPNKIIELLLWSKWTVQFDLSEGMSPVVLYSVQAIVMVLNPHKSFI
jgi:hypothetical protein